MLNDLRYALRSLRKHPGFAAIAVLTLGLGIGASTAVYTALERVVLDPLPYPDAHRLVQLKSAVPGVSPDAEWDVSEGAWFFFGRETRTLAALGAYDRDGANVLGPEGPTRVRLSRVTASALKMLGARAAHGRTIGEADDGPDGPAVVMLSYGFWQQRFGGDPAVIGTTLHIDEQPYDVIGVMERGFDLPPAAGVPAAHSRTDVWAPLRLNPAGPFWNSHVQFRTLALLERESSVAAAQRELDRLTALLPEAVPNAYSLGFMERYGFATRVYLLKDYVVGDVAGNLWVLFATVGLVLLIAWTNVVNLFLVRVEGRRHEVTVRAALGAGRARIAWLFLAEGLLLAVLGGVIALVIAWWGVDWLASLAPEGVPRLEGLQPDGTVVAFALGISVVAALALAALAAVHVGQPIAGINEMSDGVRGATLGRRGRRVRSGLVVAQVALALTLIVGAGLLVQSYRRLSQVDIGIRPEGIVTARVFLPSPRYDSVPKIWRFHDAMVRRVRALPGVEAAAVTTSLPLDGGFGCTVQGFEDREVFRREAEAGGTLCAGQELNGPGYFEAIGIPLLHGRVLTQADFDAPERGSVVVSRAFAERFWPGEDPIGRGVGPSGRTNQQFYRVVGVVGDVYKDSPGGERAIAIYYPIHGIPGTSGAWPNPLTLVVKTSLGDPMSLLPAIRAAVQDVDPAIPLDNPREMGTVVHQSMARLAFTMVMIATAASTALLLAAIGLFGVVSYVVTRRTNEIGVRLALGARPRQVASLIVFGAVRLAVLGIALGAAAALGASRALRGLLFDVTPTQPLAYGLAALVVSGVAVAAAYLPARRAARVDPMEALRSE